MSYGEDADLVSRCAKGDQRAWSRLVSKYQRLVLATCIRCGLSSHEAADASQIVWLRLFLNVERIRDRQSVAAWLRTTARNESVDHLRRRDAERRFVPPFEVETPSPEEVLVTREERINVARAFRRLTECEQRLLELMVIGESVGYAESANRLNMPIGSIGPTRGRALAHLQLLVATQMAASSKPTS